MVHNREYEQAAMEMLVTLDRLVHAAGEAITRARKELEGDPTAMLSPEYMAAVQLRAFDGELKKVAFIRDRMYQSLGIEADFAEEYRAAYPKDLRRV